MQVYHQLDQIPKDLNPTAVAIGNFDGVHLGHQALLSRLIVSAKKEKLSPSVLTFFPHPIEILKPEKKLQCLTTTTEKIKLLEECGIEKVLIAKFDLKLAKSTPGEFVEAFLKNGLRAKRVHVGFNFCFGQNRSGNTQVLTALNSNLGIQTTIEEAFTLGEERVSSSLVRKAVAEGDTAKAKNLLGRPYFVSGPVVKGDGRGKTIGVPTANVHVSHEKILPKSGVYVTETRWQGQTYRSVTNVGVRPTFKAHGVEPSVETHILNFQNQLYDETVEVSFLAHIRDERKFDSMQALVEQIRKDIEVARRFS